MLYRRNHLTYRLLDAFFRNWPPFLIAVIGVSVVVATSLLVRAASYTASATIGIVSDSEVSNVMGFTNQSWETPASKYAVRFGELLNDTNPGGFLERMFQNAKLKRPISVDPKAEDPRFKDFLKKVYINPQSKNILVVGLTWPDRDECTGIVDALRNAYIEEAGLSSTVQATATSNFLESEIERYKASLKQAEDTLVKYKINHSGQLPDAQIASLEQFANLRMERDYLSITAQDNALKSAALAQRIATIKPTAILEQTIGTDPLVQELRTLEARRTARVTEGYLETGSIARDLDRRIAALREKIASQQKLDPTQQRNVTETKLQDNPEYMDLTQQLTEAKISEQTQKARMALLDNKLAEYQGRIAALPKAERDLTEKTRDYTLLKDQYENLLKRKQQADLKASVDRVTEASKLQPYGTVYAQEATGKTKKAMMLAGSLIVGLVIGFAIILLREWMDPSLRYETDAARLLGVPVLAGLPEHPHLRFPAVEAKKLTFGGRRQIPPLS